MSRPRSTPPHAYTLVELLVVMAIIAVLAALLLPTLSRARQSALRAQCMSNVRQLSIATHLYYDENDGDSFEYLVASTNGGKVYWFGWIEDQEAGEGQRGFDPTRGALYPYLAGHGVELCPSLRAGAPYLKAKAKGATFGYGYNLCLFGQNVNRVLRPSDLAVFADSAQINTWQAPASPDHPMLEEWSYLDPDWATAHFRHRQQANTIFLDGHLDLEKPAEGSLDPSLPGQWVGCLRRQVLEIP